MVGAVGASRLKTFIKGLEKIKEDGWVQFNAGSNGYYVVHYDQALYENLISTQLQNLTPVDKQFFVHSQFLLVEHGFLDTRSAVSMSAYTIQNALC